MQLQSNKKALELLASIPGLAGIALCLLAGFWRLFGNFHLGGFEAWTVFSAGVGLMVVSCYLKLELISAKT